jgi:hypothetical protein
MQYRKWQDGCSSVARYYPVPAGSVPESILFISHGNEAPWESARSTKPPPSPTPSSVERQDPYRRHRGHITQKRIDGVPDPTDAAASEEVASGARRLDSVEVFKRRLEPHMERDGLHELSPEA